MPLPTFKNVNFQTSNPSTAAFNAGDLITKAVDSLSGVVGGINENNRNNLDAQAEGNTQRLISDVRSLSNLETFDADSQKLIDNLPNALARFGNNAGFDRALINESIEEQRVRLQDSRTSDLTAKELESSIKGNYLSNVGQGLQNARDLFDVQNQEEDRDDKRHTQKLEDALTAAQTGRINHDLQKDIELGKINEQIRSDVEKFRFEVFEPFYNQLVLSSMGVELPPEQQAAIDAGIQAATIDWVTKHADPRSATAILNYSNSLIEPGLKTSQQQLDQARRSKVREAQELAAIKNQNKIDSAKAVRSITGKDGKLIQGKFQDHVHAVKEAFKYISENISQERAEDGTASRIFDYAKDAVNDWQDNGLARPARPDEIYNALILSVRKTETDGFFGSFWNNPVIRKNYFFEALKSLQSGNIDQVDDLVRDIELNVENQRQQREKLKQSLNSQQQQQETAIPQSLQPQQLSAPLQETNLGLLPPVESGDNVPNQGFQPVTVRLPQ